MGKQGKKQEAGSKKTAAKKAAPKKAAVKKAVAKKAAPKKVEPVKAAEKKPTIPLREGRAVEGQGTLKLLKLREIEIHNTQTRANIDMERVEQYAAAMEEGAQFPKITVYFDGVKYWLADGFHRYFAADKVGFVEMECWVRNGSVHRAIMMGAGANGEHGLNMTREDKARGLKMFIEAMKAEGLNLSDREIARACYVDHKTVAAHLARLAGENPQLGRDEGPRVGKDGRERAVKAKKFGPDPLYHVDQHVKVSDRYHRAEYRGVWGKITEVQPAAARGLSHFYGIVAKGMRQRGIRLNFSEEDIDPVNPDGTALAFKVGDQVRVKMSAISFHCGKTGEVVKVMPGLTVGQKANYDVKPEAGKIFMSIHEPDLEPWAGTKTGEAPEPKFAKGGIVRCVTGPASARGKLAKITLVTLPTSKGGEFSYRVQGQGFYEKLCESQLEAAAWTPAATLFAVGQKVRVKDSTSCALAALRGKVGEMLEVSPEDYPAHGNAYYVCFDNAREDIEECDLEPVGEGVAVTQCAPAAAEGVKPQTMHVSGRPGKQLELLEAGGDDEGGTVESIMLPAGPAKMGDTFTVTTAGAGAVVGVDLSAELIEKAVRRALVGWPEAEQDLRSLFADGAAPSDEALLKAAKELMDGGGEHDLAKGIEMQFTADPEPVICIFAGDPERARPALTIEGAELAQRMRAAFGGQAAVESVPAEASVGAEVWGWTEQAVRGPIRVNDTMMVVEDGDEDYCKIGFVTAVDGANERFTVMFSDASQDSHQFWREFGAQALTHGRVVRVGRMTWADGASPFGV